MVVLQRTAKKLDFTEITKKRMFHFVVHSLSNIHVFLWCVSIVHVKKNIRDVGPNSTPEVGEDYARPYKETIIHSLNQYGTYPPCARRTDQLEHGQHNRGTHIVEHNNMVAFSDTMLKKWILCLIKHPMGGFCYI